VVEKDRRREQVAHFHPFLLDSTMSVVGVDFGLLNSVIAAAGRGGVDVILNGNSNRLNP
jgi:molecular chaperone DnaK (HSP70)